VPMLAVGEKQVDEFALRGWESGRVVLIGDGTTLRTRGWVEQLDQQRNVELLLPVRKSEINGLRLGRTGLSSRASTGPAPGARSRGGQGWLRRIPVPQHERKSRHERDEEGATIFLLRCRGEDW